MVLQLAFALTVAVSDSIVVRVLTMNDFHGALESRVVSWSNGRAVGGIAALKATMDRLAAQCNCPVLRLDAGDQMQGTLASNLTEGRSTIEALNLLGLDAAAVGNHDFDWGVPVLRRRMEEARYPWLIANVFDSVTGARPAWAKPYAIVRAGRFRVAVIGYVTPVTKYIVLAKQVAGLAFERGRPTIQDALDQAARESPDFTMIVAHEGAFCDSLACRGEIMGFAAEFDSTAVQLIVAGHTHTRIVTRVHGIPVVSAQANGTLVGVADLVATGAGREWRVRVDTVAVDRVVPDSMAEALVGRYRPEVERLSRKVIARLDDSLLTRGDEYPLGGLIADAWRVATGADFAVMNRGGVRRELYPGPITYGQLFELQPFGNTLVRVDLTGRDLRLIMERSLAGSRPDLFPSGFTVRYDRARPPGQRVIELRRSNGEPIDSARRYTLGITNFMAAGGNGYTMVTRLPQIEVGQLDLDAMISWFERQPQPVRVSAGRRLFPVTQ
jgi:2',3'-cyclic-nucleotide 2'-phosphodiesterase (5'-nucleotidase family)